MASLSPSLGVVELGGVLSTLLFGVVSVQAFDYFRDYPRDRPVLKSMVLATWFFQLAHLIFAWHAIYLLTVVYYGQSAHIAAPPQTLYLTLLFSALTTTIVNSFLAARIRVFSQCWSLTLFFWFLTLCHFATGIFILTVFYTSDDGINILKRKHRGLMSTSLVLGSCIDIMIAGVLCWYLSLMRRTARRSTRKMADSLIFWSIESTIVKSGCGIIELILFLTRDDLIWVVFYLIQSALHANTMLVSLNARHRIRPCTPSPTGDKPLGVGPATPRPSNTRLQLQFLEFASESWAPAHQTPTDMNCNGRDGGVGVLGSRESKPKSPTIALELKGVGYDEDDYDAEDALGEGSGASSRRDDVKRSAELGRAMEDRDVK